MGLFGKNKSGKAFNNAYRQNYQTQLRQLAGDSPTAEMLAVAHDQALESSFQQALKVGILTDKWYYDLDWLRQAATSYGVNPEQAVSALRTHRRKSEEPQQHEDSPTSKKVTLTPDGRGALIHGRDPNDPQSSWQFRVDSGIDFYLVEDILQKEANHMDIDLGLPISFPLFAEDAEAYRRQKTGN